MSVENRYFSNTTKEKGIVDFIEAKLTSFDALVRMGRISKAFDKLKEAQSAIQELRLLHGEQAVTRNIPRMAETKARIFF